MVSNVNRLPDRVPGGFSVRLVRPTAKGAYAPDKVIILMPRREEQPQRVRANQVPHNITCCARKQGNVYPFSFVTKRKAVKR